MDTAPVYHHPYPPHINGNGPPAKRVKSSPEEPAVYSDAVRRKLQSTSRTGQACDRCKERKMKCDAEPSGCQPCRTKQLRCFTTDRVTRRASERGQSDRTENELRDLRKRLAVYEKKHGLLQLEDIEADSPDAAIIVPSERRTSFFVSSHRDASATSQAHMEMLYNGPINGTLVDTMSGEADIAGFEYPEMENYDQDRMGIFNTSKTSVVNTTLGAQSISVADLRLPSKEDAIRNVNYFFDHVWCYVPVVHKSSFLALTSRYYDDRNSVSRAEEVQIVIVLAIIAQQMAVRNHKKDGGEDLQKVNWSRANRWLHYGLGFYRNLYQDSSLASMQAMALMLVFFRNLPKPGYSWDFSHKVLIRAIDLNYHRNPDHIKLPKDEDNPLAKDLRKRVFWIIFTFCITIGTRVSKPAPWRFSHLDVPLPETILDTELSINGITSPRSGRCDYRPMLQLCKLLPLLTELYDNVISVRRTTEEYTQSVSILDKKILAWRDDWTACTAREMQDIDIMVATLHMESWAAEYRLILHHPSLNTSHLPEQHETNLNNCLTASRVLMASFKNAVKLYNGADVTWHWLAAYTVAFGVVLHIYQRRKSTMSRNAFEDAKKELEAWQHIMGFADAFLGTHNYLVKLFQDRVRKFEGENQKSVEDGSPAPNGYQRLDSDGAEPSPIIKTEQQQSHVAYHQSPATLMPEQTYSLPRGSIGLGDERYHPPMIYPHPPMWPEQAQFEHPAVPSRAYPSYPMSSAEIAPRYAYQGVGPPSTQQPVAQHLMHQDSPQPHHGPPQQAFMPYATHAPQGSHTRTQSTYDQHQIHPQLEPDHQQQQQQAQAEADMIGMGVSSFGPGFVADGLLDVSSLPNWPKAFAPMYQP